MINSIQHFLEKGIDFLEKSAEDFILNPLDYSKFIRAVGEETNRLALEIISETLSELDAEIKKSSQRKKNWRIIKTDETSLITFLGTVKYTKTLYKSKIGEGSCYLLDRVMDKEKSERFSPDALARIYDEAADTCFRKGGEDVCINQEFVSSQTAMNKIHELKFPKLKSEEERKKVKYLYVSADEDHVSLQFNNEKGDIERGENGYKKNKAISKLIYVYEGRSLVSEGKSKRYELVGRKYFGGLYEGSKENRALWEEVEEYIHGHYELEEDGKIFVISDGGTWINTAKDVLGSKVEMVADEFHLGKYINTLSGTACDSKEDVRESLRKSVFESDKKECMRVVSETIEFVKEIFKDNESEIKNRLARIEKARVYLKRNWRKIENRKKYEKVLHGCSAEGHISHVLSSRLSSRPLGWSKLGMDKISRLRVYKMNGGDMLKLAIYQKVAELDNEKRNPLTLSELGIVFKNEEKATIKAAKNKYYDILQTSIPGYTARKKAMIKLHLAI
ncbi:ISLre2 family transposase [Eubacteriales bacterium KG127]